MENEDAPRPAREVDLVELCRELNQQNAAYVVIGGMAVIQHGLVRATEDIDLLIDPSKENQQRVRKALEILPDKAVREMEADDLEKYNVVRVADAIVVDLMLEATGIRYDDARSHIEWKTIDDVEIPFASVELLIRMKDTLREKDAQDLAFLKRKRESNNPESP